MSKSWMVLFHSISTRTSTYRTGLDKYLDILLCWYITWFLWTMLSHQLARYPTVRCVRPALEVGIIGLTCPRAPRLAIARQSVAIRSREAVLAERGSFSSTACSQLREVFPEYGNRGHIRKIKPPWPHSG